MGTQWVAPCRDLGVAFFSSRVWLLPQMFYWVFRSAGRSVRLFVTPVRVVSPSSESTRFASLCHCYTFTWLHSPFLTALLNVGRFLWQTPHWLTLVRPGSCSFLFRPAGFTDFHPTLAGFVGLTSRLLLSLFYLVLRGFNGGGVSACRESERAFFFFAFRWPGRFRPTGRRCVINTHHFGSVSEAVSFFPNRFLLVAIFDFLFHSHRLWNPMKEIFIWKKHHQTSTAP